MTGHKWSLVGLQLVWEKDPSGLLITEGQRQCPHVKQDQGPGLSWTIALPVDHGWCCAPWLCISLHNEDHIIRHKVDTDPK